MSDEECNCYKNVFNVVKRYAEGQMNEGESVQVSMHKEWLSNHCYIGVNYTTIKDKKCISEFVHLDPHFLSHDITEGCVRLIIDDILGRWRRC